MVPLLILSLLGSLICSDSLGAQRRRPVRSAFAPNPLYMEGGYADRLSVEQGGEIRFRISSRVSPLRVDITNLAEPSRVVRTLDNLTAVVQDCTGRHESGCAWQDTAAFRIPLDWPSGYYAARFATSLGQRNIFFVVRASQPASTSPVLAVAATNTYHAYNSFGGKNVYPSNSPERAYRVSFDRPFSQSAGLGRFADWDQQFVAWMKAEGRRFEVAADPDLHDFDLLRRYTLILIIGHSEYWTAEARANLEKYSAAGGHVVILGGNTMWWQARYEEAGRTMAVYKDAKADPQNGSNNDLVTVNWFDEPVHRPENLITGSSFRFGGYTNTYADRSAKPVSERTGFRVVDPDHWVFRGTNLARGEEFGRAGAGTEADGVLFNCDVNGEPDAADGSDGTPLNVHILATLPAEEGYGIIGLYVNEAGGAVFNAGSRDWVRGLAVDLQIAAITRNVLGRFATGQREIYDPVFSTERTRELFNCPAASGRMLPGWFGETGSAKLSSRCAYEGPAGLEIAGKGRVLLRRPIAPTANTLDQLETLFHLNADKLVGPVDTPVALLTLQRRRNGVNTRHARIEIRIIENRKEVRVVLFDESGAAQERSSWVSLAPGWNSVELSWQSPGVVALRAAGREASIANPRRDQKVSELQLSFPSDDSETGGYLCFDAMAAGLERMAIAGNGSS